MSPIHKIDWTKLYHIKLNKNSKLLSLTYIQVFLKTYVTFLNFVEQIIKNVQAALFHTLKQMPWLSSKIVKQGKKKSKISVKPMFLFHNI